MPYRAQDSFREEKRNSAAEGASTAVSASPGCLYSPTADKVPAAKSAPPRLRRTLSAMAVALSSRNSLSEGSAFGVDSSSGGAFGEGGINSKKLGLGGVSGQVGEAALPAKREALSSSLSGRKRRGVPSFTKDGESEEEEAQTFSLNKRAASGAPERGSEAAACFGEIKRENRRPRRVMDYSLLLADCTGGGLGSSDRLVFTEEALSGRSVSTAEGKGVVALTPEAHSAKWETFYSAHADRMAPFNSFSPEAAAACLLRAVPGFSLSRSEEVCVEVGHGSCPFAPTLLWRVLGSQVQKRLSSRRSATASGGHEVARRDSAGRTCCSACKKAFPAEGSGPFCGGCFCCCMRREGGRLFLVECCVQAALCALGGKSQSPWPLEAKETASPEGVDNSASPVVDFSAGEENAASSSSDFCICALDCLAPEAPASLVSRFFHNNRRLEFLRLQRGLPYFAPPRPNSACPCSSQGASGCVSEGETSLGCVFCAEFLAEPVFAYAKPSARVAALRSAAANCKRDEGTCRVAAEASSFMGVAKYVVAKSTLDSFCCLLPLTGSLEWREDARIPRQLVIWFDSLALLLRPPSLEEPSPFQNKAEVSEAERREGGLLVFVEPRQKCDVHLLAIVKAIHSATFNSQSPARFLRLVHALPHSAPQSPASESRCVAFVLQRRAQVFESYAALRDDVLAVTARLRRELSLQKDLLLPSSEPPKWRSSQPQDIEVLVESRGVVKKTFSLDETTGAGGAVGGGGVQPMLLRGKAARGGCGREAISSTTQRKASGRSGSLKADETPIAASPSEGLPSPAGLERQSTIAPPSPAAMQPAPLPPPSDFFISPPPEWAEPAVSVVGDGETVHQQQEQQQQQSSHHQQAHHPQGGAVGLGMALRTALREVSAKAASARFRLYAMCDQLLQRQAQGHPQEEGDASAFFLREMQSALRTARQSDALEAKGVVAAISFLQTQENALLRNGAPATQGRPVGTAPSFDEGNAFSGGVSGCQQWTPSPEREGLSPRKSALFASSGGLGEVLRRAWLAAKFEKKKAPFPPRKTTTSGETPASCIFGFPSCQQSESLLSPSEEGRLAHLQRLVSEQLEQHQNFQRLVRQTSADAARGESSLHLGTVASTPSSEVAGETAFANSSSFQPQQTPSPLNPLPGAAAARVFSAPPSVQNLCPSVWENVQSRDGAETRGLGLALPQTATGASCLPSEVCEARTPGSSPHAFFP